MGIFRNVYLKLANEKRLRKKSDKMFRKLKKVRFYEKTGKRHMRLANKYNDYVNAISCKSTNKLPKREHGWHIYKKD